MIKSKSKRPRNITSEDNQQDQDIGSIFIMGGYKKISGHVNQISIKNCIKLNLGVMIQECIKYLEYRLLIQTLK